jgi:hypothetical protein
MRSVLSGALRKGLVAAKQALDVARAAFVKDSIETVTALDDARGVGVGASEQRWHSCDVNVMALSAKM